MKTDFEIVISTYENELKVHELLLDDLYQKRTKTFVEINKLKDQREILNNHKILIKKNLINYITNLISYEVILFISLYVVLTVVGLNIIPFAVITATILNVFYL